MSSVLGHVRYGVRMLVRRPGLSLAAVTALALGIGLTTTMFSIVYVAALRGLPFEDADELVGLFRNRPAQGADFMGITVHDFQDWRSQQTSFEDLAAYYAETVNVGGTEGTPIRYLGAYASASLFDILRVRPILGRTFRPEEDHPSSPPVMILSYRAWRDRFHGDPAIIGRTVRANAEMTTIVGVMPEKFGFPGQMDAWLPLRIDPLAFPRSGGPAFEGTQLQAAARLKDGVSLETARAEMATIAGRLAVAYPASNAGTGVTVMRQVDLFIGKEAKAMLYTMLGAVFGVLLIACANVANLLLAGTAARSKEVAIRTALGASRRRTVTQLLAETLVLAVTGAGVGLAVAKVGIDFFNASLATQEMPLWFTATMDGSLTTMPRPFENTRELAVPRSIARSFEKTERRPLGVQDMNFLFFSLFRPNNRDRGGLQASHPADLTVRGNRRRPAGPACGRCRRRPARTGRPRWRPPNEAAPPRRTSHPR